MVRWGGRTWGVLVALVAAWLGAAVVLGAGGATASTAEDEAARFVSLINASRASLAGTGALTPAADLADVAAQHAADMAAARTIFHNRELGSQVSGWDVLGENVGVGADVETLHQAFLDSPGHRANVLDGRYTEVGIGLVHADGSLWVVEVFRKPTASTASTAPTAAAAPAPTATAPTAAASSTAEPAPAGPSTAAAAPSTPAPTRRSATPAATPAPAPSSPTPSPATARTAVAPAAPTTAADEPAASTSEDAAAVLTDELTAEQALLPWTGPHHLASAPAEPAAAPTPERSPTSPLLPVRVAAIVLWLVVATAAASRIRPRRADTATRTALQPA